MDGKQIYSSTLSVKKEIIQTADGSHTVSIPEMKVMYHSHHGAVQESVHVFIEAGLRCYRFRYPNAPLSVFEMGFGTGLNAFLTAIEAEKTKTTVRYAAVETAPLSSNEIAALNYADALGHAGLFQALHQSNWNEDRTLSEYFTLQKEQADLRLYETAQRFNVMYYDAFAPSAQPELWTQAIFEKLFAMLEPGGVLVTYCSKGDVRRAMLAAGFVVEKLPGPKGKREMLRAEKLVVDK